MMRHAERFFAALEDQRHDQVFLVVEMADQPVEQCAARHGVVVAAPPQRIGIAWQCTQQGIRRFGGARHVGVDGVVVALQHVETARQALVGGAEDREIVVVLDLMMDVELRQQELQPRHELVREFGGRQPATAEVRFDHAQHVRQLAKHVVARQPEPRHAAEIGVALPLLARVFHQQHAHLLRPAVAACEREKRVIGGVRRFDAHGRYIAIARANAKGNPAPRMADSPTTVARLICDEPTAKTVAILAGETLDNAACAAFEGDGGQWQVAIHFGAGVDQAEVRALVARTAGDATAQALRFEQVAQIDWVAQSLAGLKPVRAGRFIVHGAHDRARIPANTIGIEIEAALAFGTGHHGTTRGCLIALDALAKRRRRIGRALDIGTGSGVLAIAAAKIVHARVMASDIDRIAVQAARANARLNHAANAVTLLRATGTRSRAIAQGAPYDLIFANILLGPLTWLAVPVARLSRPGATIVLSGLLPSDANAAIAIYRAQKLVLERRLLLDGWTTLVFRKANRPGAGTTGAACRMKLSITNRRTASPCRRR